MAANDISPIVEQCGLDEKPSSSAILTESKILKITPAHARVPLKKRIPQQLHPHPPQKRMHQYIQRIKLQRMQQQQGAIGFPSIHREYKNYGHIQRVKFALFLKILMQHLSLTDEELHDQAQMVRSCIPTNCNFFSMYLHLMKCSHLLFHNHPTIQNINPADCTRMHKEPTWRKTPRHTSYVGTEGTAIWIGRERSLECMWTVFGELPQVPQHYYWYVES